MTDDRPERTELLAQIRSQLADVARMSEQADRLLADSTNVVADSELQDIRERLERMESECASIVQSIRNV
jgi:uncharacterized protein (UPF0335 family)